MENYYKILGVSNKSTFEEIKKAYINILKNYHPDIYQGDKCYAEKVTSNANIAYTFLSNPENKLKLDEYLNNLENNKNSTKEKTKDGFVNKVIGKIKTFSRRKKHNISDSQIKKQVKEKIKSKRLSDNSRMKLNLLIFTMFICLILLSTILVIII